MSNRRRLVIALGASALTAPFVSLAKQQGKSSHHARIANLAVKTRLPVMYTSTQNVLAGGLMSYGPDVPDQFRRAAI